jgi:enoyl-CoA hydratase
MSDETAPVRYEEPAAGVARIVLARPDTHNAQNKSMLYALDEAFTRASHDDAVKVVILAADGRHFSSGHDLRDRSRFDEFRGVTCWAGFGLPGAEGYFAQEEELYVGMCWRWRNLPKPTIAQVQGKVIAGGLMLVWPCDLIVASRDAEFSDPVVAFGVNGHEYFVHPFEVGARVAKHMLFTGEPLSAEDAYRLGMVTKLVERDELEEATLRLAQKIASRPSMGLKLAKLAVNQVLEAQGEWTGIQAAFSLHQLGHSHNMQVHGRLVDPTGMAVIREESRRSGEVSRPSST